MLHFWDGSVIDIIGKVTYCQLTCNIDYSVIIGLQQVAMYPQGSTLWSVNIQQVSHIISLYYLFIDTLWHHVSVNWQCWALQNFITFYDRGIEIHFDMLNNMHYWHKGNADLCTQKCIMYNVNNIYGVGKPYRRYLLILPRMLTRGYDGGEIVLKCNKLHTRSL